ncbi:MAG: hypothetical protein P8106_03660 [Gammaproteobacteria bacterium]|jgi:hypothetical protein
MSRELMSTRQEVAGYLYDLAWKRYRVRLARDSALPSTAPERLTAAEVRAAVAAVEMRLRWQAQGLEPQFRG